jgi:hypothetical protein
LGSPDFGATFSVAFHLGVAAGATTWLVCTFRVRPSTACVAGWCFAFLGFALSFLFLLAIVGSVRRRATDGSVG